MCILTGFPDQFTCIALNDVATFGIGIDNFTEKHKYKIAKHIMRYRVYSSQGSPYYASLYNNQKSGDILHGERTY